MTERPPPERGGVDQAWMFDVLPDVSRTFALSIDLLDAPMASWVGAGYLLCRSVDTVEDEATIPMGRRADLLEDFEATLDPDGDLSVADLHDRLSAVRPAGGGDDWALLDRLDQLLEVVESFPAPVRVALREVAREMATGMADFLREHADSGGLRLRSIDELEEYCWYVAGTVGELFTRLRAVTDGAGGSEPDPEDARSFALLLQLVNVAKDVRADWDAENNVFLPGDWLADEGLDPETVGDPRRADAVASVVERLVEHAADYADGARRYLATLPEEAGGLLEAAALPYLLALGTLRELRARTVDAVERRQAVRLGREEVEALFGRVQRGLTQEDLDELAAHVRTEPYRG